MEFKIINSSVNDQTTVSNYLLDSYKSSSDIELSPSKRKFSNKRLVISYITVLIATFGIFTNIITLAILWRTNVIKNGSTRWLLIALQISDLLVVCAALTITDVVSIEIKGLLREEDLDILWEIIFISITAGKTSSIMVTLAITAERLIALYFPLRLKLLCTTRRAVIFVIALFPTAFLVAIYENLVDDESTESLRVYIFGIFIDAMFEYIPLICIVILNIAIVHKFRVMRSKRHRLGIRTRTEAGQLYSQIAGIIIVFYVTYIAVFLAPYIKAYYGVFSDIDDCFTPLTITFVVINSSTNIIFYFLFGTQFRESFKHMMPFLRHH